MQEGVIQENGHSHEKSHSPTNLISRAIMYLQISQSLIDSNPELADIYLETATDSLPVGHSIIDGRIFRVTANGEVRCLSEP